MKSTAIAAFRISAQGYDRHDVDRVIRARDTECAQLRQRVAELEATLDATLAYLQARRQQCERDAQPAIEGAPGSPKDGHAIDRRARRVPRLRVAFLFAPVIAASAWVFWTLLTSGDSLARPSAAALSTAQSAPPVPTTSDTSSLEGEVSSQRPYDASPPSMAAAVRALGEEPDLMVVLTAHDACWISATLDGQRRVERLMQAGEVFALQAHEQMLLRVGNAGALSLTINGRVAAPLGKIGRPVTTRITVANYRQLLSPS